MGGPHRHNRPPPCPVTVHCRFCGTLAEQRETALWWCKDPTCNAVRAGAGFWVRLGPRARSAGPLPDDEDEEP
jgi:hypothetical protein